MKPHLILFGSQGSGKGTQAQRLAERHGYRVIATGKMLRVHVSAHDELGNQVQHLLQSGELVEDQLVDELVANELAHYSINEPILFDGFPRTLAQAKYLENLLESMRQSLPIAIFLKIQRDTVSSRLASRQACRHCGGLLSVDKPLDFCSHCRESEPLTRTDDHPDAIMARLKFFDQETIPVLLWYKELGRCYDVDAEQSIDEVTNSIEQILETVEEKG